MRVMVATMVDVADADAAAEIVKSLGLIMIGAIENLETGVLI